MRGRAGLSCFLQTVYRQHLRDPPSVGFAATFSRKREKETCKIGTPSMTLILSWLTSKLAGPILGACSGVLLIALIALWIASSATEAGLRSAVKTAQTQADAAGRNLAACQGNQDALTKSLNTQNASLVALKAQGDAATASADKAVAAASSASTAAQATAAKLLAAKPGADLCASADAMILETLK